MACMRSSTITDIHNDEITPLAVAFESTGENTITHADITGIFPFKDLPTELQNKIIGYAVSAVNWEIRLPCLTNRVFKPGIAVGLFLVNHRIYHEAQYQFRKLNTFIFGNFGSDLNTIASSVGPLKCRSGACGYGTLCSTLAKVTFDIGDDELPGVAEDRVYAFGCALRYLRSQIIVNSLHLRFAFYTFRSSAQLSDFASGLSKIKVQERLSITGDEQILNMSIREIPAMLRMNRMPAYSQFSAYTPDGKCSPGLFFHLYVPEIRFDKVSDPQQGDLVVTTTETSQAERAISAKL